MRVLQVHKDFEPFGGGGGTARHIHGLAEALSADGCQVRVVAPAVDPRGTYEAVACRARDLRPHVEWAEVVHVHGARSTYAVRGALTSVRAGRPFFYTPHAYYAGVSATKVAAKLAWDRTAEKFLAERSARTILLTNAWRNWLEGRGIATDRTVVIPNCVLLADLQARSCGDGARLAGSPAILSIGRLDPVKRLDDVLRALQLKGLEQAHFHVVGKGEDRPRLEALAAELGVADRVTFYGFVSDEATAAMAAGSDVFVLASEQEGLPTVLLEMLIARLPIACSRIPGNMAIADAAGAGSFFDVGDVPRLAAALIDAASSHVADDAVTAVCRAFAWEQRAGDILSLYRQALVDAARPN